MPLIDTSTEFGQRVQRRLEKETVIWLTTQDEDGTPQPSPVWFLLENDDEIILYSQPNKPKVRNIEQRPVVALNFNATESGGNVVIFHGEGWIGNDAPACSDVPNYIKKYATGIAGLGMTPKEFAEEYSVPIRIKLTKLRGF
ncbi:MAG TPA: TIGR03667 family PPOX class F420-dependent oxidoreductase [Thermomicrobiales bacterium]|nr:TIGR03667 family PPOX class F420-dependent oxidoreductase [Thermomicrobiales bacterium]